MNTELNDKLDLIIAWAARDCENDEAEKFKNIDTSGVVLSAGFYARKRRLIGRYKLRPALAVCRKCFVRVAVVLMALMSIGFLTVMAIPNVRNAMFDAVVEWYETTFQCALSRAERRSRTERRTSIRTLRPPRSHLRPK